MKKRAFLVFAILGLLILLSVSAGADIAAKRGDLALFLKPSWTTGSTTSGHWVGGGTVTLIPGTYYPTNNNLPDNRQEPKYVPGTKAERHGGRKFYQYEEYAGDGILFTVKPSANGLPTGYRHKGTVVISELGWKEQTPLTPQDVWEIWQELPDTYKYKKSGVTQIQLLSDDYFGICYDLDNKYGRRDLRILVYGALLSNDADADREKVREMLTVAINGEGLNTKQ